MLKRAKKVKYLKTHAKMYKIWKNYKKGQVIACDYCTELTARKGPEDVNIQ